MVRKICLFTGLFILAVSCNFFREDGYRVLSRKLAFKLEGIGDSRKKALPDDYLSIHFIYKTMDDSVFFEGMSRFRFTSDVPQTTIGPVFRYLNEGDSASLVVNTIDYFFETLKTTIPSFLIHDEVFRIEMKILDIQSKEEFEGEKNIFLDWVREFNSSEAEKIRKYLDSEGLDVEPTESGLYFIPLAKGKGPFVIKGHRIRIHYQGRFLNGKFVDDTYKRNEPLDFVFGTEFYIIDGMEEALDMMREGDRALVIIPSDLAFGAFGSAGGIVPPFSTMIYELEVIKVF